MKTLEIIQQEFKKIESNINFHLLQHHYIEFIQEGSVQYSKEAKRKFSIVKKESDGILSRYQRKLNIGGYEDKIIVIYTDSIPDIAKTIMDDITHYIFLPVQKNAEAIITDITGQIMRIVVTIKSDIATIINELTKVIVLNEGKIADKETFIATVQNLHRRNEMLNEDIDAMRKIFTSQETRA